MIYKGVNFELNSTRNAVRLAATPLMIQHTKLRVEYLGDYDTSIIDMYEKRINELSNAIEQIKVKDQNEKVIDGQERTYGEYLIELTNKLDSLRYEYLNDDVAQVILKGKNDIEAVIISGLIAYPKMVKSFLDAILIGDKSVIDYDNIDKEFEAFFAEVLVNFFTIFLQRENELQV